MEKASVNERGDRVMGASGKSPGACLYPAVTDQLTGTAGFFPEEADYAFWLSVNRHNVKDQQFSRVLNVRVNWKSSSPNRDWSAKSSRKSLALTATPHPQHTLEVENGKCWQCWQWLLVMKSIQWTWIRATNHFNNYTCYRIFSVSTRRQTCRINTIMFDIFRLCLWDLDCLHRRKKNKC